MGEYISHLTSHISHLLSSICAASPLRAPPSKLAPGKRTPRHPFGFPGLAGHGSGLRPTRNFTEVSH